MFLLYSHPAGSLSEIILLEFCAYHFLVFKTILNKYVGTPKQSFLLLLFDVYLVFRNCFFSPSISFQLCSVESLPTFTIFGAVTEP